MHYVIHVGAGKEKKALALLQKYVDPNCYKELFIPQFETRKHIRGKWRTCTDVLLPGYLFVLTNEVGALNEALRGVPAFTRLLGNNNAFTPLIDQEVAFISAFTEPGHRVVRMSEGVIEGDEIVVIKGPLMNQAGLIKKIDRHKRLAYLEISILGRAVSVKVGLEIVTKRN